MLGRFLALVAGVAGAVAGSQAPGFTLQYMQNLAGRIDELQPIVEEFDASVASNGYTRDAAIAECEDSAGLLTALCSGYAVTVRRYELLSAHQADLRAASDYLRPLVLARMLGEDNVARDIAKSALKEYKPAIPTTLDGAAYAGGGFAVAWGLLSFLFGFLGALTGNGRRYYR